MLRQGKVSNFKINKMTADCSLKWHHYNKTAALVSAITSFSYAGKKWRHIIHLYNGTDQVDAKYVFDHQCELM